MKMPTEAGSSAPEFLTVDEAAGLLRVNRKTLCESIRLGQIPGVVRVGKALRIRRAALVESSPGKGRGPDGRVKQ
ncbi:helix-turn-helix domain-containing protein [Pyxidicoccus fallax]|uniref:Helix-turn-helix domain-containing protein n=1 Tax=Pyxidicoccus fallax TaxID=394095 RepID=A0A848L5L4_9BACT|nr:helix-turn-helix domain-containing protein [Pyxidicoccus fallax]NMO13906.1 helix-turn-helix domain-containing protein [Pyxidicoccus fallax]NPC78264.1 helix-turn-helix domain-containing protein [Pyxidicoccus fallax]